MEVPKVEGVEKVEWVAEVVGFVGVQGEYVVEFGIEGEVVEEMKEEEMEEEEGMGLESVLVPVEGEAVRHRRYLLRSRQCRVALRTSFWRLPHCCFSSSLDSHTFPLECLMFLRWGYFYFWIALLKTYLLGALGARQYVVELEL